MVFDYKNLQSLEALFEAHPDQIAAVMLEPSTTITPCLNSCDELTALSNCKMCSQHGNNFLIQVESICRKHGALFILDEMITGFRWSLHGASHYFGVKPDLMTFGKGMANGFSVAAVTGKREFMEVGSIDKPGMERTFLLSSTHGGEMSSLGAFVETVKIYQEQNVCKHLWEYGAQLRDGLNGIAKNLEINHFFYTEGPAISLNYLTKDSNGNISLDYRTLFNQEMIKQGVLMPWISVSQSHGEKELRLTLDAAEKALSVYRAALKKWNSRIFKRSFSQASFS